MKETRNQDSKKLQGLWKNITSNIKDKVNNIKDNISDDQNEERDMSNSHTPISRLDLSGMNKEQAKEVIGKLIDEKLEKISHIEISELHINHKEKERQRAEAAMRIDERRNKRKHKSPSETQTIITEQGVYSDYKQASVFDVIQPEAFPYEEELPASPIEGQLSMLETIEPAAKPLETQPEAKPVKIEPAAIIKEVVKPAEVIEPKESAGFDVLRILEEDPDEQISMVEGTSVNTTFDATLDKAFEFYEKSKANIIRVSKAARQKTAAAWNGKIIPVAIAGTGKLKHVVVPLLQKIEEKGHLKNKMTAVQTAFNKKEALASEKMYGFIERLDQMIDVLVDRSTIILGKIRHRYDLIREYAEHNKKKLLIEFGIGIAAITVITLVIGSMTAYEYIYNGKVLGVVKNQEDVYKTVDIIGDKLSTQYDAEIAIDKDKDIRFNKVVAFNQEIDTEEDILNRFTYMRDMKANGHGIFVDGSMVAIMESEESAKEILETIQARYQKADANIQYKSIGFAEAVTIKDVETKLGNIDAKDDVLEYLLTGAVEEKIHLVQSGETFSEIAKMYGLKQSELKVSNPDVIPEKLKIGQEICLNQIVPLVTVQTTEVAQYKEAIPFEIAYENTANLYKNEQTVKSRGANGEKDVVAEIVRNNGIEVARTEISSTIITQPVSQVVMIGTKELPPLIGTGTFIYPIRGTLSSRFGYRWGRLHSGIDLAAPIGTYIKAADGGKVTFAGYNGSLGYMVAIDHGGGRVTWYGHCSKLFVKSGDRVFQGQHIANVGNTGRSTGPHVHFEVHINGTAKNPLSYL